MTFPEPILRGQCGPCGALFRVSWPAIDEDEEADDVIETDFTKDDFSLGGDDEEDRDENERQCSIGCQQEGADLYGLRKRHELECRSRAFP